MKVLAHLGHYTTVQKNTGILYVYTAEDYTGFMINTRMKTCWSTVIPSWTTEIYNSKKYQLQTVRYLLVHRQNILYTCTHILVCHTTTNIHTHVATLLYTITDTNHYIDTHN